MWSVRFPPAGPGRATGCCGAGLPSALAASPLPPLTGSPHPHPSCRGRLRGGPSCWGRGFGASKLQGTFHGGWGSGCLQAQGPPRPDAHLVEYFFFPHMCACTHTHSSLATEIARKKGHPGIPLPEAPFQGLLEAGRVCAELRWGAGTSVRQLPAPNRNECLPYLLWAVGTANCHFPSAPCVCIVNGMEVLDWATF